MTLVGEPSLVLADEPSGQLDASSTDAVVTALLSARSPASTIVVATHDPAVADACDRVLEIRDGDVVEGS